MLGRGDYSLGFVSWMLYHVSLIKWCSPTKYKLTLLRLLQWQTLVGTVLPKGFLTTSPTSYHWYTGSYGLGMLFALIAWSDLREYKTTSYPTCGPLTSTLPPCSFSISRQKVLFLATLDVAIEGPCFVPIVNVCTSFKHLLVNLLVWNR